MQAKKDDDREQFVSRATEAFARGLEELLSGPGEGEGGGMPEGAGSPEELGRKGALAAGAERAWRRRLGVLYETRQVQSLLEVGTRQAVTDRAKRGRLLALPTGSGRRLYPAFQFGAAGQPFDELGEILPLFEAAGVSPWTVAAWFQTPQELLEGETPAAWLRTRARSETAVEAARRSAARLSA